MFTTSLAHEVVSWNVEEVKIHNPHVCHKKPLGLRRRRNGYSVLKKTHHKYYCNFVTTALGRHEGCDFGMVSHLPFAKA